MGCQQCEALPRSTSCLTERCREDCRLLYLQLVDCDLAFMNYAPFSAIVPRITASISLLSSFFPASPLIRFAPFFPPFAHVILYVFLILWTSAASPSSFPSSDRSTLVPSTAEPRCWLTLSCVMLLSTMPSALMGSLTAIRLVVLSARPKVL